MDRDWFAFAGTVIGGFPIYKEAWENLLSRRMTMELSMNIALLSALTRWAKTFWQAGPATGVPRRTQEANCPSSRGFTGVPDVPPYTLCFVTEVLVG